MGYVGNEPSVNFTSFAKQDITGDGGASYTLTYAVANANEIEVFVNNVRQEPTSAYSVSGTALTMTGNVASTDDFYVIYLGKALQTTTPPDGSVTTAKIVDDAVTSAKLDTNIAIDGDLTVDTSTLKVDSTNNRVGIGTASPSQALHVAGGNPAAVVESTTSSGAFIKFENTSSTNTNRIGYAVHDFVVDTNGSERLRILSDGRIGHLATSAIAGAHFTQTIDSVNGPGFLLNSTDASGNTHNQVLFRRNGADIGSIQTNSSSTSYNTSSDHRLKENVTADWDATTRLKQLNPVRFNFIADADTTLDGFLAHEVQSVVPEAISGTHNEVDDDGNPVYQGIDQSKLVPLLVKTIQELEARITALENS